MPYTRRYGPGPHPVPRTPGIRVMLITCPAFATWVGLGYLTAHPRRYNEASFAVARELLPMQWWGIIFLAGAAALTMTTIADRPVWIATALIIGFGVYLLWALVFGLAALLYPAASVTRPAIWAFIATAHAAMGPIHIPRTTQQQQRGYVNSRRNFGRRGAVLTLMGGIYVIIGVGYATTDPTPTTRDSLTLALTIMPLSSWGLVWITAGVAAILAAYMPAGRDAYGYVALAALSAAWSAVYALGLALGAHRAWLGAIVWAAMATVLVIIAGWAEPGHLPDRRTSHRRRTPPTTLPPPA